MVFSRRVLKSGVVIVALLCLSAVSYSPMVQVVPGQGLPEQVKCMDSNNSLDIIGFDGRLFLSFWTAPDYFAGKKTMLNIVSSTKEGEARDYAAEEKTLRRVDDPLVVEGKILEAMSGARLDRLSLMVCSGDGFEPVPFQVDEKNPAGEYVYTHGPMAGVDADPNLDANDELVFMAESIGSRCDDKPWPESALAGVRIEVTDPIDQGKGWLYLFEFEGNPPRSPLDLISIEATAESTNIKARDYIWGANELRLADADGKMGPDILDRVKSRGVIDLPLIDFEIKSDESIRHEAIGWIDGPVRVVICNKASMKIFLIERDLSTNVVYYYYPNSCVFPATITMRNPEVMKMAAKVAKMNFVSILDYNENGRGIYTYDAINPYNPEVVFDGKMSEAENNLNTTQELDWIVGFQPGMSGVLIRFVLPEGFKGFDKGLYYREDDSMTDPPEDHPGIRAHGFQYSLNLESIEEGQHRIDTQYYFKPGLIPGQEKALLDIVDRPLKVRAGQLDKAQ